MSTNTLLEILDEEELHTSKIQPSDMLSRPICSTWLLYHQWFSGFWLSQPKSAWWVAWASTTLCNLSMHLEACKGRSTMHCFPWGSLQSDI